MKLSLFMTVINKLFLNKISHPIKNNLNMLNNYNNIDLMDTKEIIQYLSRYRYSSMVIIGMLYTNKVTPFEINGAVYGSKQNLGVLYDELNDIFLKLFTDHEGI